MPLPGEDAMKRLPKEKRNHLVLVGLLTGIALVGVWFGVIKYQKQNLASLAARKQAATLKLELVKKAVGDAERIEIQLCEVDKRLARLEEGMASGDLYSWVITAIRQFKLPYKVEIPQFSQIDGPKETNLLPRFPYKQATITVAGTARFHDLGKFIADFENQFPYMRLVNLSMEPAPAFAVADRERLSFRMDIITLVKPGAA
jgi:Tfp pilus assembly protein PilO